MAWITVAAGSATNWSTTQLKMVKTWSHVGTILVNSSGRAQELPSSNAPLAAPYSVFDCGQPQGHRAGTPQPTVPAFW